MATDCSNITTMSVLVGTNGTGKTTATKVIAENFVKMGFRVLVVTPDDREWTEYLLTELRAGHSEDFQFSGIRRHIWNGKLTLEMLKYFQNGVIIFDDCRAYFRANTDQEIRQLLIRRRQRNVHIMACGHGFTEVPLVFFTFATDFILFLTRDNIERRKYGMRNFEAVKAKQEEVNAIVAGKKAHPKDYVDMFGDNSLAGKKVADMHYFDRIKNE